MLIDLTHMEFEILSDSRKPNFRTKKWEFKYFDDHPVPENIPYRIWVMKDKVEIYIRMRRSPPEFGFGFLLPSQVDAEVYADILLKTHPINNASLRNQYMLMAGGYDIREIYLKPHKIVLTKQMRKQGSIIRHFVKYIFDIYERIFEVSGIRENINFYDLTSFRWQINGSREQILLNNTKSLEIAEKNFPGIQNLLNPLEFYEEEMTPYEEIQKKLGRLKFPPESTDTSSNQPPPPPPGNGGGSVY